jgi:hypothetical protein
MKSIITWRYGLVQYGLLALPIGKRQCINGVRFVFKVLAPT